MNTLIKFDVVLHREALDRWLAECRRRIGLLFPQIDFDADHWLIRTLYQTAQPDWYFSGPVADFAAKDRNFCDALRCQVAEMVIAGKPKDILKPIAAFRRLASTSATSLFDLTLSDMRAIEVDCLLKAKARPAAADGISNHLSLLAQQLALMASKKVLPHLGYQVRTDVRAELSSLAKSHYTARRAAMEAPLDRKMEAFNVAFNFLIDNDPRLDALDRVAICAVTRKLCAPSRINEIMCSSIDDHVTINDYVRKPLDTLDATHSAHQMLLVTMKGSKGAQWGAKPVLSFMIDAFNYTTDIILEHSKRSRRLVEWYQAHPTKLYLPPELESLRGQALSRSDLAKILYLTETPARRGSGNSVLNIFAALKGCCYKAAKPSTYLVDGRSPTIKMIDFLPWSDVEKYLLQQIHQAMADCRRVTHLNPYEGDLSKMLFLFDRDELPYLPYSLNALAVRKRLKRTETGRKRGNPPSLFEKLGITMPVAGKVQIAEIDTHDPRRWLTTMALRHGEKLSDVLINKWANRSSLSQLKAYDFRSADELATFSRMPDTSELTDLSEGLTEVRKLEEAYGLKTEIVAVHDAGINVTSLDRILQAVDDRPIARTSEQIIILYPSRYGVCLHQHHETPCRRYDPCLTCDRNVCVKGHLPTNDEVRKDAARLSTAIVRQLETLVPAFNRGVADHPETFTEHLLMLVGRGLCPEQMADNLISEFHEIKDQIKDKLLRKRLEEAFVARGYVQLLDDNTVSSGALMKYHNPKQHAAPGLEMALDTHGGREQVARDEQTLIDRFPVFAPTAIGLTDERHLLESDDDTEEDY